MKFALYSSRKKKHGACYLSFRSSLPSPNSLNRWFGEPVRAAILLTDVIFDHIDHLLSHSFFFFLWGWGAAEGVQVGINVELSLSTNFC